jgi:peptidoglycan/xylan/chitin deacetylase (PgdA/CDA1 family)
LKISLTADKDSIVVIQELLSVWDIDWVKPEEADVALVYGTEPPKTVKKAILIPSSSNLSRWEKGLKLKSCAKRSGTLNVPVSPTIALTITPKEIFEIAAENASSHSLGFLQFDVVREYYKIVNHALDARTSPLYRLATNLPLSYNKIPKRYRDYLMKSKISEQDSNFFDVLPMDALRFALKNAIEQLSNGKLCRRNKVSCSFVCLLTHDVDTKEGLKVAKNAKKLEEKYDLPSAWFLTSNMHSLNKETVQELGNNGEVGSHDTKHDGKLCRLSLKDLTLRLGESKQKLEELTGNAVYGFRAPLLQHNRDILQGLKLNGYSYDTSIPTWEARHPRTMDSHGIGTVFPIVVNGITEIPVSVMQDHQSLYVLGLTPKEVISRWLFTMSVIKEIGGCCTFLSHPEYSLLDNEGIPYYEELLNTIASSKDSTAKLPSQIAFSLNESETPNCQSETLS